MRYFNQVEVQGYCATDLYLKYDEENKCDYVYFTLYTPPIQPKPSKDRPIVFVKNCMMFRIKAYNKLANYMAKTLKRGTLIIVCGSLINKRYTDYATRKLRDFVYISAKSVYYQNKQGQYVNVNGEIDVNEV